MASDAVNTEKPAVGKSSSSQHENLKEEGFHHAAERGQVATDV
jgi:hypothetical protein